MLVADVRVTSRRSAEVGSRHLEITVEIFSKYPRALINFRETIKGTVRPAMSNPFENFVYSFYE